MESKECIKSSIANNQFEWFLVQYDQNPKKFIRKVVKTDDLMWNEVLQNDNEREHVLVRDCDKLYLGFIICRTKKYEDAIKAHNLLKMMSMRLLHSPEETNAVMNNLHFDHDFWLLVIYSTTPVKEEQSIYAILHKTDVILQKDNHSNNLIAYVQENQFTFKGVVAKVHSNISFTIFLNNFIKNDFLKKLRKYTKIEQEKSNREKIKKLILMEQNMNSESKILWQASQVLEKTITKSLLRLIYLQNLEYMNDVEQNY